MNSEASIFIIISVMCFHYQFVPNVTSQYTYFEEQDKMDL